MRSTSRLRILLGLLGGVVLLGILPMFSRAPVANRTRTVTTILQLYLGITVLEDQQGKSLASITPTNAKVQRELITIIPLLLHSNGVNTRPIGFGTNFTDVIDAWGEPLRIEWIYSIERLGLNPAMQLPEKHVVIWSKGPNRRDELGYGDDVFYKP